MESFEELSSSLGCSVDHLIGKSMLQFLEEESSNPPVQEQKNRISPPPPPPARSSNREQDDDVRTMALPAVQPPPPPQPAAGQPPVRREPPQMKDHGVPQKEADPRSLPTLYLHFEGERHQITEERFVIGRGKQGTDLTIKDSNISRKHAAVIFHENAYYIQDLGSTNGIEFLGQRISTRTIEEGDVYAMCDYKIQFSFQK